MKKSNLKDEKTEKKKAKSKIKNLAKDEIKSELKEKPSNKSRSQSKKKSRSSSRSRSRSKSKNKNEILKESLNKDSSPLKKYPDFPKDEKKVIKIIHWNINGLMHLLRTKELDELIKSEDPDFICFNEIKISNELIIKLNLNNLFSKQYKSYWYVPTEKKGYSGTAILTKYEPISVSYGMNIDKHDKEGRIITLEYDKFYLICCYTPNSGQQLKRLDYRLNEWDKDFFKYINSLKNKKDIILTGDLNVAKENIDIHNPKGHEKYAGFTQGEKESFRKFLKTGYIDTFRKLHPKEQKFSFFTIKKNFNAKPYNKGWRLDYFVINKDPKSIVVKDSDMLDKDKYNSSDHIPLIFTFSCKV